MPKLPVKRLGYISHATGLYRNPLYENRGNHNKNINTRLRSAFIANQSASHAKTRNNEPLGALQSQTLLEANQFKSILTPSTVKKIGAQGFASNSLARTHDGFFAAPHHLVTGSSYEVSIKENQFDIHVEPESQKSRDQYQKRIESLHEEIRANG